MVVSLVCAVAAALLSTGTSELSFGSSPRYSAWTRSAWGGEEGGGGGGGGGKEGVGGVPHDHVIIHTQTGCQ